MKFQSILLFTLLCLFQKPSAACTGGSNAGSLSPTAAYQTQSVQNGQYYSINVTCGDIYNFTFCSNGGTASWDTQITLNQTDNTTQLAYNDDNCGLQSQVSWTATFSGTIHVLISQYSCNNDGSQTATLAYNVTSTSVAYAASCTSANATITGNTSGTFAFNPVPGDGALIDAGTGTITNAVEGANYSVDYTYCGGTINIPVTMGSAPCYTLNGNALYIDVSGEQCIQLTDEINNQTGCAWNGSQVDFSSDFSLSLDYYFGNNGNGADGNTFTFQTSSSTACGQAGGQLGAGGLSNALTIEFDTYDNDNPTHLYDMSCDHIAVEIDGDMQNAAPYAGPVCAKPSGGNIDDGGTYHVEITWNATTEQLEIYFDGNLRLTCNGDFVNTVFGGQNNVYWGATSATGGLNNQQYFCPSTVVVLPVELTLFETYCTEEREIFHWVTDSENNVDYFELEYTFDGIVYYSARKIQAMGNSSLTNHYTASLEKHNDQQRYYRLKIVDKDGYIESTDLIKGNSCALPSAQLIHSVNTINGNLQVALNHAGNISLIDQLGKIISSPSLELEFHSLDLNTLSKGVYYLHAWTKSGHKETTKIFIGD